MSIAGRARRGLVMAALVVVTGTGCASYSQKALRVRDPLQSGDYASAQAFLEEEKPGGDGLPYLMELGLVLRYGGDFTESNRVFEAAEQLIDELYTQSISRKVLALATSDEAIPYDGEAWERVLINYYRALNYIELGDFDAALVECRKINHKLKVYTDSTDDPPTYRTDAFAQYLTAILYEIRGDRDDAWVSLRLADEAYGHYAEAYGVKRPPSLVRDMFRLAGDLGYRDELRRLEERFPDTEWTPTRDLMSRGEIVVFYEEGFIPAKRQVDLTVPILKHEYSDDHFVLARTLSGRVYAHPAYKKSELEYLLRLAVPEFRPPTLNDRPGYALITAPDASSVRTEMAEDLDAIARQELEDRRGGILFKTIARALGKYALTRGVEKKKGDLAGKLVNLVTAATEKADTRSWLTLPRSIQVARIAVEPGTHTVEIEAYGPLGELRETVTFEDVEVGPGQVQVLSHRTF